MNLDNFTNKAEAYAKGRPGYPREAFEKIIELASSESVFADIGAGTGKFTRELAEYGYTVYPLNLIRICVRSLQLRLHLIKT